jgi:hypothetical protein
VDVERKKGLRGRGSTLLTYSVESRVGSREYSTVKSLKVVVQAGS